MNAFTVRLAVAGLALVLAFVAGWRVASWRAAAAHKAAVEAAIVAERAAHAGQLDELRGKLAAAEALGARRAIEQNEGAARVEKLQGALELLRGRLTERVQGSPDDPQSVPVLRRTLAYRVCVNAAVTGGAASVASCEAGAVPLTVPDQ